MLPRPHQPGLHVDPLACALTLSVECRKHTSNARGCRCSFDNTSAFNESCRQTSNRIFARRLHIRRCCRCQQPRTAKDAMLVISCDARFRRCTAVCSRASQAIQDRCLPLSLPMVTAQDRVVIDEACATTTGQSIASLSPQERAILMSLL